MLNANAKGNANNTDFKLLINFPTNKSKFSILLQKRRVFASIENLKSKKTCKKSKNHSIPSIRRMPNLGELKFIFELVRVLLAISIILLLLPHITIKGSRS